MCSYTLASETMPDFKYIKMLTFSTPVSIFTFTVQLWVNYTKVLEIIEILLAQLHKFLWSNSLPLSFDIYWKGLFCANAHSDMNMSWMIIAVKLKCLINLGLKFRVQTLEVRESRGIIMHANARKKLKAR